MTAEQLWFMLFPIVMVMSIFHIIGLIVIAKMLDNNKTISDIMGNQAETMQLLKNIVLNKIEVQGNKKIFVKIVKYNFIVAILLFAIMFISVFFVNGKQ
ncbi:MAG: hypothetical protein IKI11_09120 [Neisseriaceae bacterium]|nr:hypothetical protein [Neisseriaceae bacterium]